VYCAKDELLDVHFIAMSVILQSSMAEQMNLHLIGIEVINILIE